MILVNKHIENLTDMLFSQWQPQENDKTDSLLKIQYTDYQNSYFS